MLSRFQHVSSLFIRLEAKKGSTADQDQPELINFLIGSMAIIVGWRYSRPVSLKESGEEKRSHSLDQPGVFSAQTALHLSCP